MHPPRSVAFPPSGSLPAGGYLLRRLGENRTRRPEIWHTNSGLDGDGEYLALRQSGSEQSGMRMAPRAGERIFLRYDAGGVRARLHAANARRGQWAGHFAYGINKVASACRAFYTAAQSLGPDRRLRDR